MESFAEAAPRSQDRAQLTEILSGHKPFRHFKDAVHTHVELREQRFRHRDQAQEKRARKWLQTLGIEPEWTGFQQI